VFRRCGSCKQVQYCSQKCQISHWEATHREECAKMFRFPTMAQLRELKVENEKLKIKAAQESIKKTAELKDEADTRTQSEILKRLEWLLKQGQDADFFAVRKQKLVEHLEYKFAQPHIDPKFKAETWIPLPCKRSTIIAEITEYVHRMLTIPCHKTKIEFFFSRTCVFVQVHAICMGQGQQQTWSLCQPFTRSFS
jgi:hypothetical protein